MTLSKKSSTTTPKSFTESDPSYSLAHEVGVGEGEGKTPCTKNSLD